MAGSVSRNGDYVLFQGADKGSDNLIPGRIHKDNVEALLYNYEKLREDWGDEW